MQRPGAKSAAKRRKCEVGANAIDVLLDYTRILILAILSQGCRRFIELRKLLNITKGRLYFHLEVLEEHCIVRRFYRLDAKGGPALYFCLTEQARDKLPMLLDEIVAKLNELRYLLRNTNVA